MLLFSAMEKSKEQLDEDEANVLKIRLKLQITNLLTIPEQIASY